MMSANYPEPLVVEPLEEHKQTWIVLHGRGSNARKFGPEFLATQIPSFQSLPLAFPKAKFVFPTASFRRAAIYKRSRICQWFDNWSLQRPSEREELQREGLRQTAKFIHDLLRREIAIVGAKNIILGGLSQGCAAALISLLLWDGEPLGALFGMCGWLPYQNYLRDIVLSTSLIHDAIGTDDSPFEQATSEHTPDSPIKQAITYLHEELDFLPINRSFAYQQTPVLLGHGAEDEKVPLLLGQEAHQCLGVLHGCLSRVGTPILREYTGLGHWYSGAMLRDIASFVLEAWHRRLHYDPSDR